MLKGKIIFYNKKTKFGFIKDNDANQDYYFKGKNLKEEINEGDEVEYELKNATRGLEAINIKKTV